MGKADMKAEVKRSPASLYGGIVSAAVIFGLWLLILWEPSALEVVAGAIIAGAVGVWTRLANL